MPRDQRRLTAIVAADVVGYSRLMGRDESATLAALKAVRRDVVDPCVAAHGGRLVKTTGDGLLLAFTSVVDAVRCALETQAAMARHGAAIAPDRRIVLRIGVNLGDVIIDGDDIFGDGVNVAARLQEIAAPGGVCLSNRVHDDIRPHLDTAFVDGGERTLKNIARVVRVWSWSPDWAGAAAPSAPPLPPPLPDKPSIAVLPFANMSGDAEQEYFADGVVEDIITALSRNKALFVIARNSTFTYKGKAVDIRRVGRELGVRYVLEGSIRRAGERLRITGQLIDAGSGSHIWADRFEGRLEDVFELQDQLTARVVGAITPVLEQSEIARVLRKPTESLEAYDLSLRAVTAYNAFTRAGNAQAISLLERAMALDPGFALAYGYCAQCYTQRRIWGWEGEAPDISVPLARRALELDRSDARVLVTAGYHLLYVGGLDEGADHVDDAVEIDPNYAAGWAVNGLCRLFLGRGDCAPYFERALRLSPLDPRRWNTRNGLAQAHFIAGRYEESLRCSAQALGEVPGYPPSARVRIAALAMAGRLDEARAACAEYLEANPSMRLATVRRYLVYRRAEDVEKYLEAFRLAGMPA